MLARRSHISIPLYYCRGSFFAEAIRTSNNIKGIQIFENEFKISQYADDTSLYIQPDDDVCMELIESCSLVSGLTKKTKVIKMVHGETAG